MSLILHPAPKWCEFCETFTDHGDAEIARLRTEGWTIYLPDNFQTCAQTQVPFCENSSTSMWHPDKPKA